MACGRVVGQDLEFGISDEEASLVTQSVSVTNKTEKKEARDKCGIIVAICYYNLSSEVTIEGLGVTEALIGDSLSLAGTYQGLAGATFIEEITIEKKNEEFTKSTIKAMSYSGVVTGP